MSDMEEAISSIEGWMVTNGPLSSTAEMGLKEIMDMIETGVEEYTDKINKLEDELEEWSESEKKSFLAQKVEMQEEIKALREALREGSAKQEKEIERLKAEVDQAKDKLKITQRVLRKKVKEMEQDSMSAAW